MSRRACLRRPVATATKIAAATGCRPKRKINKKWKQTQFVGAVYVVVLLLRSSIMSARALLSTDRVGLSYSCVLCARNMHMRVVTRDVWVIRLVLLTRRYEHTSTGKIVSYLLCVFRCLSAAFRVRRTVSAERASFGTRVGRDPKNEKIDIFDEFRSLSTSVCFLLISLFVSSCPAPAPVLYTAGFARHPAAAAVSFH